MCIKTHTNIGSHSHSAYIIVHSLDLKKIVPRPYNRVPVSIPIVWRTIGMFFSRIHRAQTHDHVDIVFIPCLSLLFVDEAQKYVKEISKLMHPNKKKYEETNFFFNI